MNLEHHIIESVYQLNGRWFLLLRDTADYPYTIPITAEQVDILVSHGIAVV